MTPGSSSILLIPSTNQCFRSTELTSYLAAEEAIRNAGIGLSESIGGVGDEAIREALLAIADLLELSQPALIEVHP